MPSQEAPILKKQLSNIMSLDPEEKSASDVEQIYQVLYTTKGMTKIPDFLAKNDPRKF